MADSTLVEVRHHAATYRRLAAARIRSDLQYRTSFFLRVVGQTLVTALDFAAISAIFGQVPRLEGWRLEEIALLYGINGCAFALADLLTGSIERVNLYIRLGTLDRVLVRPVPSLVLLTGDEFALRRVGKLVQAGAVHAIAVASLDLWRASALVHLVVAVLAGAAIFAGVFVLSGAAIFWLVEGREVMNSAIYGGHFLNQYPLPVFGRWLQKVVVYVLPIAFVAYFPSLSILGKADPLGFPSWFGWLSPAVATGLGLASAAAWRFAVRHYRSTGS